MTWHWLGKGQMSMSVNSLSCIRNLGALMREVKRAERGHETNKIKENPKRFYKHTENNRATRE